MECTHASIKRTMAMSAGKALTIVFWSDVDVIRVDFWKGGCAVMLGTAAVFRKFDLQEKQPSFLSKSICFLCDTACWRGVIWCWIHCTHYCGVLFSILFFFPGLSAYAAKRMLQRQKIHVESQNDCWLQVMTRKTEKLLWNWIMLTSWVPEQVEGGETEREREQERAYLKRRLHYYLIVLLAGLNCRHLLYILKLVPYYYCLYLMDLWY